VDFSFSDEQDQLRASVRQVMADRYPIERVALIADGVGFDPAEWSIAAEAGWTDMSVAVTDGGAGLGFVEEAIVAEELGRSLYPGPFLASTVMSLPIMQAAGVRSSDVARGTDIATVAFVEAGAIDAAGEGAATRLSGEAALVVNLDLADLVIVAVPTDGTAWLVETTSPSVDRRPLRPVDGTRTVGSLRMRDAPAQSLHVDAEALRRARDRGLAALAAEACGVAARALELSVTYARDRRQFGRAIGSFQAVSHELARTYMDVETARSLTYWAAGLIAEGDQAEAPAACAAAKARAAEGAVAACERAIQAHGGIGFTWEHPLHRFYKRALAIGSTMQTADEAWSLVADLVLGVPAGAPPAAGRIEA
jgi:alkylation response protein AidB-like acyl-CoA dehydrogenase